MTHSFSRRQFVSSEGRMVFFAVTPGQNMGELGDLHMRESEKGDKVEKNEHLYRDYEKTVAEYVARAQKLNATQAQIDDIKTPYSKVYGKETTRTLNTYKYDEIVRMSTGQKRESYEIVQRVFKRVQNLELYYQRCEQIIRDLEIKAGYRNKDGTPKGEPGKKTLEEIYADQRTEALGVQMAATTNAAKSQTRFIDWYSQPFTKIKERAYHLWRLPADVNAQFINKKDGKPAGSVGTEVGISGGYKYYKIDADVAASLSLETTQVKLTRGGSEEPIQENGHVGIANMHRNATNDLVFTFNPEKTRAFETAPDEIPYMKKMLGSLLNRSIYGFTPIQEKLEAAGYTCKISGKNEYEVTGINHIFTLRYKKQKEGPEGKLENPDSLGWQIESKGDTPERKKELEVSAERAKERVDSERKSLDAMSEKFIADEANKSLVEIGNLQAKLDDKKGDAKANKAALDAEIKKMEGSVNLLINKADNSDEQMDKNLLLVFTELSGVDRQVLERVLPSTKANPGRTYRIRHELGKGTQILRVAGLPPDNTEPGEKFKEAVPNKISQYIKEDFPITIEHTIDDQTYTYVIGIDGSAECTLPSGEKRTGAKALSLLSDAYVRVEWDRNGGVSVGIVPNKFSMRDTFKIRTKAGFLEKVNLQKDAEDDASRFRGLAPETNRGKWMTFRGTTYQYYRPEYSDTFARRRGTSGEQEWMVDGVWHKNVKFEDRRDYTP